MSDRTEALLTELVELQRRMATNQEQAIAHQAQSIEIQKQAIARQRRVLARLWIVLLVAVVSLAAIPMLTELARAGR